MGRPIALGREIGRGGEGAILEVTHESALVAKVYHATVERERIEKLKAMARVGTPGLLRVAAWPVGTLHDAPGGELVGILIPRIAGHQEIHQLYSPAQRKLHFPKADWAFLLHVAMNCAAAFETIHEAGHVVGDVNQSGVLVSSQATVRLIDCDSFQIRDSGKLFFCVVGVPQYTPPELQGRAFRGVERTRDHDAFGLALLVFHLLFMGRHPFAGRFHGSGDMPIERAISEGRFAFGRAASSYQMTPPPHSLPLDSLPQRVGEMFERAFARPHDGISRPTAKDWREAMTALKSNIASCGSDKGHRYPSHLGKCPWCAIMGDGGPNFFIAVQVVAGGVRYDLPSVDFDALWRRVDAVRPPMRQRPQLLTAGKLPKPTPLPEALKDQLLFLRLAAVTAIVGSVLGTVGLLTGTIALWIGMILLVVFGIWWLVLLSASRLHQERTRRRSDARRKRAILHELQMQWDRLANSACWRFDALKAELWQAREQGIRIQPGFDHERRIIDANRRDAQLQDYLENHFIRDYRIPKIGRGRLATLLSYGVETAADVNERRLDAIPGFGPAIVGELVAWRNEVAKGFRFDPKKPAPPGQMQALIMKYRHSQQVCEARLSTGAQQLAAIAESANHDLAQIATRIQHAAPEARQADADARII